MKRLIIKKSALTTNKMLKESVIGNVNRKNMPNLKNNGWLNENNHTTIIK